MDTDLNLLFGVVALQTGAVDADCLARTCADWATEPTLPLAALLVDQGMMTAAQRTELEKVVSHELEAHGGDPHATLAATVNASTREVIGKIAFPNGHVLLDSLLPADESRDRYTLTHLHAKGGMGQVWLARDKTLGRLIALKELRPEQADNPAVNARFLYEARITAQLEHPGIVPVYEMGQGEAPYYTMRFVRGRTLSAAIRDHHVKLAAGNADSVETIELLTAFVGVCRAMAYAHSRGIIHRDLKGQNIALGDFGEVMVLDWGLAKRIGPGRWAKGDCRETPIPAETAAAAATDADQGASITVSLHAGASPHGDSTITAAIHIPGISSSDSVLLTDGGSTLSGSSVAGSSGLTTLARTAGPEGTIEGELLGTPGYMAPEQAQGRHDDADERTDVYGLGAILYEILTDRPPFTADKTAEIIRKICHECPTPPSQVKAGVDPRLQAICLKALAKKPGERFVSASELALDVQRWLGDLPVEAYPERWTSHALRWARRHKTIVASIAGLLAAASIALVVIIIAVTIERIEAEAQGTQARRAVQLLTKVADVGFDDQLDSLQREFLEGALAYYNKFTNRVANDPKVRQEHGRAYQQMGDIERKLGRLQESQRSYRKAIEIIEPLADFKSAEAEPRRALARTRALLADLLVRGGGDNDQAERLYNQAILAQQVLASAPAAITEDRLRLGQSLKSQADLLRLNGQFSKAKPVYDQAIAVFEPARAADPRHAETRNDLAMATDARGWIERELGDVKAAEQDYRSALALLDTLIAEFPTSRRYRESLARMCNSLGLIEQSTGRLSDAEIHLRRELSLAERLSQDFPDRPEFKRELARTWMNLGNVLSEQGRPEEAEPALVRAVELNRAIAAASPEDVQIRLDLARCHTNLGGLRRVQGEIQKALESLSDARSIGEKLVADFPDQPRYREQLAGTLIDLALALEDVDKLKAEQTDQESVAMFEKLVASYPDNIDYRIGLARCFANFAPILAASNRVAEAKETYRKALAALEANKGAGRSPGCLRQRGIVLNNLGQLLMSTSLPEAEFTLLDALGAFEGLAARESPTRDDRQILAIVHANLGKLLVDLRRLDEAGPHFEKSVAGFETLVALQTRSIATWSFFGMVLEMQANWLDRIGKPEQAKQALESAITHQRHAVELSQNGASPRERLGSHQLELAWIDLKVGANDEAARIALELPGTVPDSSRPRACFDAARVLARRVSRLGGDSRLTEADRAKIARNDIGRLAIFLREAIDIDPKLAEPIKTDADIKWIASRPEFRAIIETVIDLGDEKPK